MIHQETESGLEIANETCDLRLNRPRGRAAFTSNTGYKMQLRLHIRAHMARTEGVYETETEGDVGRWNEAPREGGRSRTSERLTKRCVQSETQDLHAHEMSNTSFSMEL